MPKLSPLRVGVDCAILRGRREHLSERLFIEDLRESQVLEFPVIN